MFRMFKYMWLKTAIVYNVWGKGKSIFFDRPWRHTAGLEVLSSFVLDLAVDGGERSALRSGFFIPLEGVSLLIELEGGWTPDSMWPFWRRGICFAHVGILSPDLPARSLTITLTTHSRLLQKYPKSLKYLPISWWSVLWRRAFRISTGILTALNFISFRNFFTWILAQYLHAHRDPLHTRLVTFTVRFAARLFELL